MTNSSTELLLGACAILTFGTAVPHRCNKASGGSVAKRAILLTHLIMDSIYSLLKPFGFFSSNRDQDEVWYSTTLKSCL